jgi:hypothetical protein
MQYLDDAFDVFRRANPPVPGGTAGKP